MGIWNQKRNRDSRSPADLAAKNLSDSIDFGDHNYQDLQNIFISLAVPDALRKPINNSRPNDQSNSRIQIIC